MDSHPPKPENSYAPPTTDYAPAATEVKESEIDFYFVRQFRHEIHAFGGSCMLVGFAVMVMGGLVAVIKNDSFGVEGAPLTGAVAIMAVIFGLGVAWIALGAFTCRKRLWAVYTALTLSYVLLLVALVSLNLCGVVILSVVTMQGHRVMTLAGHMQRAGVPLSARPEQFAKKSPKPL